MRAAAERFRSAAAAAAAVVSAEAFRTGRVSSSTSSVAWRLVPFRCVLSPSSSPQGFRSFAPAAAAVTNSSKGSSNDNSFTVLGSVSFVAGAAAAALAFRSKDDPRKGEKSGSGNPPAPSAPSVAAPAAAADADDIQTLVNWSGTHEVRPRHPLLTPETVEELEEMISSAHREAEAAAAGGEDSPSRPFPPRRVRCVGSALSPNGLAFEEDGMISLSLLDKILEIDEAKRTVRVQGGARVQSVADALRSRGLTLPVYASIREQSVGGYCQAGVHGTGARIGPADEYVSRLKLVTPSEGTIELSSEGGGEDEARLFRLARVALGALGAVAEAEIRCDPLTWLVERTTVLTRAEAFERKEELVRRHKHVRFMWIPHADAVVVVALDEAEPPASARARALATATAEAAGEKEEAAVAASSDDASAAGSASEASESDTEARAPLEALVPEARERRAAFSTKATSDGERDDGLEDLSPMLLRQWLLSSSPLDVGWVKRVAEAEAEHWRRRSTSASGGSEGDGGGSAQSGGIGREGWSDEMLGFDCAGAQWVLEVAMPAGSLKEQSGNEMEFMAELLERIERGGGGEGGGGGGAGIPAHAPIEQRWSAGSRSTLSPVCGTTPSESGGDDSSLHSWVGIILYLPEDEASAREWRPRVDGAFASYARIVERELSPRHGATEHWAKVEPTRYVDELDFEGSEPPAAAVARSRAPLEEKRRELARRFGAENVGAFAAARQRLDPHNVMGGRVVDDLFPHPGRGGKEGGGE